MPRRIVEEYEQDSTPSRAAVEQYRAALERDEDSAHLALVTYRGTREELDLGLEYSFSNDPLDRQTGTRILGELGWDERTFLDESVTRLIAMLADTDHQVIYSAAIALGRRGDPTAIPYLLPLATHPDSLIRFGVVCGLSGYEDDDVIKALIDLTNDEDIDVRDWAVFGLGSQIDTDTAAIRQALWRAVDDSSSDVRGEALVGLAKRRAPGVIDAIIREWRDHEEIRGLSLEAAAEFPGFPEDGEFDTADDQMPLEEYRARLIAALEACRPASLASSREPLD